LGRFRLGGERLEEFGLFGGFDEIVDLAGATGRGDVAVAFGDA
jgi:hypothetical protein